jgi:addiction module RelE/StbE family toxin
MRIRWTQPAASDLTSICDYIDEHNSSATARRVAQSIYRSVSSLEKFPYRGRKGRQMDTRELVISNLPYIVIYRVNENVVEVLRILHGAQDWP